LTAALALLRGSGNGNGTKKRRKPCRFKGVDHFVTEQELEQICANEPDPMYVAVFRMLFKHAMRVSECLALRREDIQCGFVTIRRLKGSLTTTQRLLVDISAYIAAPTYRIFPCSRSSVFLHWRKAATRAGLRVDLRHPHVAKHGCIQSLLLSGVPLQVASRYAGHASIASTAAYLNCGDLTASAAAAKVFGGLFDGSSDLAAPIIGRAVASVPASAAAEQAIGAL
jgi:integrase